MDYEAIWSCRWLSMYLQNICKHLQDYTLPQPTSPQSEHSHSCQLHKKVCDPCQYVHVYIHICLIFMKYCQLLTRNNTNMLTYKSVRH
jgi:hypothetical protein